MIKLYEATFIDMEHASDGMGREYTTDHSLGLFTSFNAAADACLKHFGKKKFPNATEFVNGKGRVSLASPWRKDGPGLWRTDDFGWAMYGVKLRKVKGD